MDTAPLGTPAPQSTPQPTPTADPSAEPSIQDQLEQQLFGGPIAQTAPQVASLGDQSALSDSSGMGGMDYSFYSDPASYMDTYLAPTQGIMGTQPYTSGQQSMLDTMAPTPNPDSYDYVDSTYDTPSPGVYDPNMYDTSAGY